MKDFERIVVVAAQNGEKFLGWVPEGEDPKKYMEQDSIKLHDARIVATQHQPKMNAQQQVVGVSVLVALIQVDMFPGPIPVLRLHPSTWYFPCENLTAKKQIAKLIEAAQRNETVNKAAEAGLHIPGA
jgi:hypothetical protein